ncbi:FG-GAP repeat protein [Granulicella mallensis]|uniref:Putative repeat protein (TIGR01451 family) n=1 Tax=Granulicella mallensis TaxID=940614 RepID=A0A7W8EBN3_9BACT|nr:FG-GAP repeat protein [Granulicella mallensis]MBB5066002.1 putative repeat protein (TIGR01451 family) [Granulicella mallensis]
MFSVGMPRLASLCLVASGVLVFSGSIANAQQTQYSSVHRSAERTLPQTLSGGTKALRAKLAAGRSGISLALADFDGDGTQDLVTGYSTSSGGALTLQRGSSSATAPSASDWAAMQRGELVSPFVQSGQVTELPVQPDFLKAADINGNGTIDIVVAARGGSSIYVLLGDGHGGFSKPQALPVQGTITALSTLRTSDGPSFLVASVCGGAGDCVLQVMAADGSARASLALPEAASVLEAISANGHQTPDIAVIAGGKLLLADGPSIVAGTAKFQSLPVTNAAAISAGSFVYDRRGYAQLAVLDSAATLHLLARNGVDSSVVTQAESLAGRRNRSKVVATPGPAGLGWAEVETLNSVGSGGATPIMLHARLSGSGGDDLLVLSGSEYVTVRHAIDTSGATVKTTPSVTLDSTSNRATAAVAVRVSPDARQGVVIADGTASPNVAPTLPTVNKIYTVNTTADSFDNLSTAGRCTTSITCSLRDAMDLANKDSASNISSGKIDTVNLPAGTYKLTNNTSYTDQGADLSYHIEITGPVNLVGAGAGGTVIDGQQNDKIFSINSGINVGQTIFDTFISGVTLQNAKNNSNFNNGAFDFYGGILDWDADGGGNLTITNSTLQNSTAPWGPGGAIAAFDATNDGTGTVELDNCVVLGNSTPEEGGGLYITTGVPLILNATTVANNKALVSVNSGDSAAFGQGGGIFYEQETSSVQSAIINGSVISGNQATDSGGGVYTNTGLAITASTLRNNTSGASGGGLFFDASNQIGTITSGTFTSNHASTDGGGIFVQSGMAGNTLNMHYSRIQGNTAGTHTGLGDGSAGDNPAAAVNATDNWWGCNGPATGTGCDTAGANLGTLTLTPYTTLVISLNSTTPASGTNVIATGSLGQDSGGTTYTKAQDAAYLNVPATLTITQGSATVNSSATALDPNATITTSTPTTASGTATVTVDGTSVSASFSVTSPILKVTSTHLGSFIAGSTGNNYTLSVANSGNASTSGTVTVVDTLPSGFTAAAMSGTGWNCVLGTLTCTTTTVLATGSSLPAITLTVSVSGTNIGVYSNAVAVSGGGAASGVGTDSTTVVGPPTMVQAFVPNTAGVNQVVALTFQISNPNTTTALTGISLVDILPTQMVITTPNGLINTCGGTPPTAAAGGNAIIISGATLAAGANCTVSVNVVASAPSVYVVNSGPISAQNGGLGLSGSAMLTVNKPPTLVSVTPGTSSIFLGGTTSLTYVLSNPNGGTSLTGVALTDTLPAGLIVGLPNGASTTCSGGTVTAASGGSTISLSGATLAANTSCSFTVDVLGTIGGNLTFSSGAPTSANGGTGVALSVNIDVIAESIWLINANDTLVPVNSVGNSTGAIGTAGGVGMLGAVAFDHAGNVWAVANGTNSVIGFTSVGTAITVSGNAAAGVSSPTSLAIDGLGMIWVANGNNTVSVLDSSGAAVTPSTGYKGGLISAPTGIIVDNSGSVWISNGGNGSVTKIIGGAAPVTTPTVTGTLNNTLGTRP